MNGGESHYWKLYALMETYRKRLSMIKSALQYGSKASDVLDEIALILEGKRD